MTRFSNGINLHLKSKKKGSRKKVEIEKKLSKKERRQLDRKEKLKVEPPLPNVVFKDNAPIVITIVGEDNARNMVYDKVFSKFIKSNFYDTTKFCANFNNSEKNLTNNVTFTYKSRKITLLQVKDDLDCLVDYSKISDLTILAIEDEISFASYEYITLLSAHGLSKLCVYNIKGSASSLRKRIFKEISVKVPIFNNTTLVLNYISKMRVRPLTFRSNNAYILVDYINEGCFYGYLRGTPLTNEFMHLPGLGDYKIKEVERLNKEEKIKYEPEGVEEEESLEDNSLEELISEEESDLISQNNVKENQSNTEEGSQSNLESNSEESSKKEENKKGLTEKELEKKFEKKFVKKSFLEKEKENFKKQADSCTIDFIPGAYLKVKLELKNEYEKIKKTFEKNNFLLMGSIKSKDKKIITGNLKPHKWNKRLIKSGAPSLISIGWHRMLINPLLSTHDGKRERFLKHNLEFNNITFLSPIYKNTRFLLLKNDGFRIHGLGTIEEKVPEKIKKKCKLVGEVKKSYNNTAFIKNMFNSKQEVLKFLGGKLSSVSGLRGVIKRPIGDYGEFRSTFEGQLIERDVVFLKCYFTVEHDYKCILEEEKIQKELIDYEKMIKEKIEQKESSDENFVYKEPIRKKELFSREISKITKKLPFNKKEILINEEKILSPEEQLFLKEKERIIELKRKIENKKCEEIFKKKENKENEIEEKKKGKVKSIIKSAVKSKRAKKGKKKRRKRNKLIFF